MIIIEYKKLLIITKLKVIEMNGMLITMRNFYLIFLKCQNLCKDIIVVHL